MHLIKYSAHNDGILMAYLPKEKILVEVDVYTPPVANAPAPANRPMCIITSLIKCAHLRGTIFGSRQHTTTSWGCSIRRNSQVGSKVLEGGVSWKIRSGGSLHMSLWVFC